MLSAFLPPFLLGYRPDSFWGAAAPCHSAIAAHLSALLPLPSTIRFQARQRHLIWPQKALPSARERAARRQFGPCRYPSHPRTCRYSGGPTSIHFHKEAFDA